MAKAGAGNGAGRWWRIGLAALVLVIVGAVHAVSAPALTCEDPSVCGGGGGGTTGTSLTVTVQGKGTVTDSGLPSTGHTCTSTTAAGTTCTFVYASGATAHPAASASPGWGFGSWGTNCTASGPEGCDIVMEFDDSISVTFNDVPPAAPAISSPVEGQVIESTTGGAVTVGFSDADPSVVTSRTQCFVGAVSRFNPCSTGWSTGALGNGPQDVTVTVQDDTGHASSTTRHFTIVNTPSTQIISTPPPVTGDTTAGFSYSSTGADGVNCVLDPADPNNPGFTTAACPTSFASLSEGTHRLVTRPFVTVSGTRYFGAVRSYSWRVDTTAPDTVIDDQVDLPSSTTVRNITFHFSKVDASDATFQCSLDAAAFGPCPGGIAGQATYSNLPIGNRSFRVRATDAVGHVDATPASWSWSVLAKDGDGDGFFTPGTPPDCNDADPAIHPGALEINDNSVDENCDGILGVNLDRDGDGVQRPADCNDSDASIHPGAYDKPGDAIDQDCAGGPADYGTPATRFISTWAPVRGGTAFPKFTVVGAPAQGKVTLSCKGKGCRFKRMTLKFRNGVANLTKQFKKTTLGKGAVLTLQTTAPDMFSATSRMTITRAAPKLTKVCARPGTKKTFRCV
jgi:hypothetical protein